MSDKQAALLQAQHNYYAVTGMCKQSFMEALPLLLPGTTSTQVRMISLCHDPMIVRYRT